MRATSKASLMPTHQPLAERILGFAFGLDSNAFGLTDEQQRAGGRLG